MDAEEDDKIDKNSLRTNEGQSDVDEKAKLVLSFKKCSGRLTWRADFAVVCYLLLLPVYYDQPTF